MTCKDCGKSHRLIRSGYNGDLVCPDCENSRGDEAVGTPIGAGIKAEGCPVHNGRGLVIGYCTCDR